MQDNRSQTEEELGCYNFYSPSKVQTRTIKHSYREFEPGENNDLPQISTCTHLLFPYNIKKKKKKKRSDALTTRITVICTEKTDKITYVLLVKIVTDEPINTPNFFLWHWEQTFFLLKIFYPILKRNMAAFLTCRAVRKRGNARPYSQSRKKSEETRCKKRGNARPYSQSRKKSEETRCKNRKILLGK